MSQPDPGRRRILSGLAAVAVVAFGGPARAAGGVPEVRDAWARPGIAGRPAAVYMRLRNPGPEADRLVAARSPRATRVELHRSEMKDGMMSMAPVEAVDLPPGAEVALAPGGLHLMVFGAGPLAPGDTLPLTLVFERAGAIEIAVPVRDAADGG